MNFNLLLRCFVVILVVWNEHVIISDALTVPVQPRLGRLSPRKRCHSNILDKSFTCGYFELRSSIGNNGPLTTDSSKADPPALIFNLAKSIVGSGILSLPAGVAAFSDSSRAIYPVIAALGLMGSLAAYSFTIIGKACKIHNSKTFSEAWKGSINAESKFISLIITFKTLVGCLCYSMIIGDSFRQILSQSFINNLTEITRTTSIGFMTIFVVLPLCLLKNLDSLKYSSLLGLTATLYTTAFVLLRYFDKSYCFGQVFHAQVDQPSQPLFGSALVWGGPFFQFLAMASSAYVAHYNAPKIWTELRAPTEHKYKAIVSTAFATAASLYLLVACFGFLTFGKNSQGLILNNYAGTDGLAQIARLATGLGLLCSYPLSFFALRENMYDLLAIRSEEDKERLHIPLTLLLLTAITICAILIRNVGAVVGVSGALIGTLLIFILPAIMNIGNGLRGLDWDHASTPQQIAVVREKYLSRQLYVDIVLIVVGASIACIGFYNSVKIKTT